jgi:hypothetical protein
MRSRRLFFKQGITKMRDPTGDWERGRRENRRQVFLTFGALVSAVLSVVAAMAVLVIAAAHLHIYR